MEKTVHWVNDRPRQFGLVNKQQPNSGVQEVQQWRSGASRHHLMTFIPIAVVLAVPLGSPCVGVVSLRGGGDSSRGS